MPKMHYPRTESEEGLRRRGARGRELVHGRGLPARLQKLTVRTEECGTPQTCRAGSMFEVLVGHKTTGVHSLSPREADGDYVVCALAELPAQLLDELPVQQRGFLDP